MYRNGGLQMKTNQPTLEGLCRLDCTIQSAVCNSDDEVLAITHVHNLSVLFHPQDIDVSEINDLIENRKYEFVDFSVNYKLDPRIVILPTEALDNFGAIVKKERHQSVLM